ncbi:uncharacterized protein LOC109260674 [Panthera pardus]|uniref:Uncharacterized protein LOC109260674 n=1 Tax=Panthera pardus TaxID=9691 RepID=A0A9W2VH36_PANPR|nr:uncharacterized protein LOC109260674 [Panthera pardus]
MAGTSSSAETWEVTAVGAMLSRGKRDGVTWGLGVRSKFWKPRGTRGRRLSARSDTPPGRGERSDEINGNFRMPVSARWGAKSGKLGSAPGERGRVTAPPWLGGRGARGGATFPEVAAGGIPGPPRSAPASGREHTSVLPSTEIRKAGRRRRAPREGSLKMHPERSNLENRGYSSNLADLVLNDSTLPLPHGIQPKKQAGATGVE